MDKVKLTLEQAKAMASIERKLVESMGSVWASKSSVVEYKVKQNSFAWERSAANDISLDDFITALYVGYEVELTPEEKVREYYEIIGRHNPHGDRQVVIEKQLAIRHTLNLLGIKIEGVNAE